MKMICDHISSAFKPNEYICNQSQNLRDGETLKSGMRRKSSVESLSKHASNTNNHNESTDDRVHFLNINHIHRLSQHHTTRHETPNQTNGNQQNGNRNEWEWDRITGPSKLEHVSLRNYWYTMHWHRNVSQ